MQDETERWLTANVDIAASALEQYMKLKYHRNMTEREARMPFPEQIKRACQHCAKGVKFKPEPHPTDFRVKYPEYPLMYHVGDFGCTALDIRRKQFNAAHPELDHSPEPRWCMNPECRCKLPNGNSRKGKADMNICVNNRCGKDNSKFYPEKDDV